ncbi:High-affinity branched-chain amino acid transport system permease protein LivH [Frondihabitans sp. 762G35]|uniref:branched-chain amino acid ABC transporter permease n=1 Tax=Frondihabitans sp. 762G35 TaxID=1446794 RepID=UPI000D22BDD1|nr:branched-chain amino acid ABC transporter permease [Frondihabitans sp. 762G35]ARC55809.1 High-affinity branched-chain amino acid transport system permease protein LivH [Frondihabitans sp. 762G35]
MTLTPTLAHPRRRSVQRGRHALVLLASMLMLGLVATMASLAVSPSAASAATVCATDASTACIQGTLLRSDSKPAAGVDIQATSPAGDVVKATTDATGRWVIPVKSSGTFTVRLVESTLPSGQYLANEKTNDRKVAVTLGSSAGTIFQLSTTKGAVIDNANNGSDFSWQRLAQQSVSGIRLGLLLALAAIGLSLVYGTTGLQSFAHGEQVTLGGLLAYTFANVLGMNLILAAVITVIISAATGFFQDMLIWKPLRKRGLSLTQLMIVTIGLSIALQYAFQYFYGAATVRIDTNNPTTVNIGGVVLTVQSYVAMGISIVVLVLSGLFLLKTRTGRATRAVSDNPALAAASGIDVDRIIRLVWTIAAGLAGLSGVMLGLVLNGVNWQTGLQILLLIFAAVTLGGLGTAFGALVGSLIVGIIVELTNLVLPGDFKYATALLILIVILLFRPQGIFGRRERIG